MGQEQVLGKIQEIERERERYRLGGGPDEIERQHKKTKLTARERVEKFFDPDTFHELELWAQPIKTGFEIDEKFTPADAVVTGYGEVNGRTIVAYTHDYTVLTGTQSAVQHSKVSKAWILPPR